LLAKLKYEWSECESKRIGSDQVLERRAGDGGAAQRSGRGKDEKSEITRELGARGIGLIRHLRRGGMPSCHEDGRRKKKVGTRL